MKGNKTPLDRSFLPRRYSSLVALALAAGSVAAQVLPPFPGATNKFPAAASLYVREFHFEGNHAFTSAQLSEVTKPFTDRQLSSGDLEEARRDVSRYYISHGYVNSGAEIPDQD